METHLKGQILNVLFEHVFMPRSTQRSWCGLARLNPCNYLVPTAALPQLSWESLSPLCLPQMRKNLEIFTNSFLPDPSWSLLKSKPGTRCWAHFTGGFWWQQSREAPLQPLQINEQPQWWIEIKTPPILEWKHWKRADERTLGSWRAFLSAS